MRTLREESAKNEGNRVRPEIDNLPARARWVAAREGGAQAIRYQALLIGPRFMRHYIHAPLRPWLLTRTSSFFGLDPCDCTAR